MILLPGEEVKVYLRVGATDLRKAINGLSILVQEELELDPFSGAVYGFCNRRGTMLKILYWSENGFCLWMKRLERNHFRWPESRREVTEISWRELEWLLAGFDLQQAHGRLDYTTVV